MLSADVQHQFTGVPSKSGNCHKGTPFTIAATYSGGAPLVRDCDCMADCCHGVR